MKHQDAGWTTLALCLRTLSDMDLFASYEDKQVWQALSDQDNTISHNANHTYWADANLQWEYLPFECR